MDKCSIFGRTGVMIGRHQKRVWLCYKYTPQALEFRFVTLRDAVRELCSHLLDLNKINAIRAVAMAPRLATDVAAPPRIWTAARPSGISVNRRGALTVTGAVWCEEVGATSKIGADAGAQVLWDEHCKFCRTILVVFVAFVVMRSYGRLELIELLSQR
eukprot:m.104319 g.104319  ORF g.104319 m.104319 type:complete len:158 (-) comp20932_c0_seq1:603-1076(-)